jgi:hypothetical protein
MKKKFKLFLVFSAVLMVPILCQAFGQWPDTGQLTSSTDTFGEDSDYNINPQSYTKLGHGGVVLSDAATNTDGWMMVKDNVTGLIWEVKTVDGSIHDKNNTYTWCDTNPETNGGYNGSCGSGTDTTDFIDTVNSENFGGFSDWRMPTVKELATIVNSEFTNPRIDHTFFPNTQLSGYYYWSSTTRTDSSLSAWNVSFYEGVVINGSKSLIYYVRAVRGEQSGSLDNLVDNGDGTITDTVTGLMWQKVTQNKMKWEPAISYCETLSLANYGDWRLPNRNELQSLVNYSRYDPAIDTFSFPDTKSDGYWSSTNYLNFRGCFFNIDIV